MLEDIKEIVFSVAESALVEEECVKNLVLVVNEFSLIILTCRNSEIKVDAEVIERIIESQMKNLNMFSETEIASLLYFITEYIKEFKNELSVKFVENLLCRESVLVTNVTFNNDRRVKNGLIKIYHDILALKNVPVIQVAYKCIIDQFGSNLKKIPSLI